ncbi:MAG: nucleotidyl transferase AbiEii/AbiGii toxin family protein [Patescibacteria group bacterium]
MLTIEKHRTVMLSVLKEIYEDTFLGPILGLKGGTLLYILYDLPRFSVDLDFDLLDPSREEQILPRLEKILKKFGEIEQLISKKYTYFGLINYETGQQGLKIEISKRNFGSSYEVNNYLGIAIKSMTKPDILANKLTALLARKKPANRDVFDTWFLLNGHWDINWGLIEKKSSVKRDQFIKNCISLLEKWPLESILEGLGELIDNKTKDWVKLNLVKDTIFYLKLLKQSSLETT